MLTRDEAVLMVVDVQGKLARLMHEADALFEMLEVAEGRAFKRILDIVK